MSATPVAQRRNLIVTLVCAPWRAAAWVQTAQVVTGCLIALPAGAVIATLAGATASLAVTVVLAVPPLAATLACGHVLADWQRARLYGFTGVRIPAPAGRYPGASWLARLRTQTRDAGAWRQVAYHLVSGLASPVAAILIIGGWALGALLSTVALYGWALPPDTIAGRLVAAPAGLATMTALGLATLLAAPWLAHLAARLDVVLAASLLAPSPSERLTHLVAELAESRTGVIDAADAERRRIERDLHDGTQQRLVSLAMNLGLARTTLTDVPPAAREAIEQAHDEVKLALAELRDLVRGMHPAVLDDLGLDAALSGVAARSPVPVRLLVDLPRRPPRAVEAVAYFVVSEALTNVAKHAGASRVDVVVEQAPPAVLRVIVSDDGRGGADPGRGTGLSGLRQRVRSVDGTLRIDSPPGGPTLIIVELPCAS